MYGRFVVLCKKKGSFAPNSKILGPKTSSLFKTEIVSIGPKTEVETSRTSVDEGPEKTLKVVEDR